MISYIIEYKDRKGQQIHRKFATYEMARMIYHTLVDVGVNVSMTTNDDLIDPQTMKARAQYIADNLSGRD